MSQPPASRRTTSLTGSSRLALSVGKTANASPAGSGRHPLKQEWSISYVHRPPGTKVDYEKEIKRVASFGSIESFLQLYSHLVPPNELQPVTDVLVFLARMPKPGIWESMPDGGRFTFRLLHPITPVLYESLLFAMIGDQFEESERVVGCVLSVRQTEDLISVWVEEEGEAVKSGSLREKILTLLGLPSSTVCEYRSNRAMLEAAATTAALQSSTGGQSQGGAGAIGSGVNGTGSYSHAPDRTGGYASAPGGERERSGRNYHSNYSHSNRNDPTTPGTGADGEPQQQFGHGGGGGGGGYRYRERKERSDGNDADESSASAPAQGRSGRFGHGGHSHGHGERHGFGHGPGHGHGHSHGHGHGERHGQTGDRQHGSGQLGNGPIGGGGAFGRETRERNGWGRAARGNAEQ